MLGQSEGETEEEMYVRAYLPMIYLFVYSSPRNTKWANGQEGIRTNVLYMYYIVVLRAHMH